MTKLVKFGVRTPIGLFERLGAVVDDRYVDLNLAYTAYLADVAKEDIPYEVASVRMPPDLQAFIEGGKKSLDAAKEAIQYVKGKMKTNTAGPKGEQIIYEPKAVELLAPLPSLKVRMFAMGRNFSTHAKERELGFLQMAGPALGVPKRPAGFLKNTYSVTPHEGYIVFPKLMTKDLDYEVEVIAYIGKKGKDIPKEKAMEYIIGYTVGNDVSARDQQALDQEDRRCIYNGKNADTLAPMGPFIVLTDEIPDPHALEMEMRVNGDPVQRGSTSEMVFKFDEILAYFSRDYTIYPGDMIWSGTPAAIKARVPLKVGDLLEAEVKRVGLLRNRVVE